MDPNEALAEIRRMVAEASDDPESADINYLVDLVDGLDKWLSTGGFLPKEWERCSSQG